ncbi:hypothetical protein [Streptomyces sp. NPDC051677]|uniref:hypothetical protein n=1 Tax=Streptomyces sp. NPDC051677 TaxID=3365669 RepID=UPI0037D0F026
MARLRGGTAGRGRTRWSLFAAVAVLPALVLVWLVVFVVKAETSDYPFGGGPEKASCAEALAFGGAKLPPGAYDTECSVQSWQDVRYLAEFRMPRDGVGAWLTDTYPEAPAPGGPAAGTCLHGSDYCFQADVTGHPGVYAYYVDVDVTYENAETARVRYSAFTT